jgi:hypothetical protein
VFVTWGDLTTLACDAWLLPTDQAHDVEDSFRNPVAGVRWPDRTAEWQNEQVRSCPVPEWNAAEQPWPWFTNMGGSGDTAVEWYLRGVRDFVRGAAGQLGGGSPFLNRARPLLALPIVGIRHGGAGHQAGGVIDALVKELRSLAEQGLPAFDAALVAYSAPSFAAAQSIRRRDGVDWPELEAGLLRSGEQVAACALRNQLVLFLGAGVSMAAKAPSWKQLLLDLATEAGLAADELEDFRGLSDLDAATLIERRTHSESGRTPRRTLGDRIKKRVDLGRPSLLHTLLAALPVRQAVTTNYDRLFELACGGIGERVSILPYEPDPDARRWLLKLHGCVTRVDDIVLTREDYLRYEQQRAALAGIVQALLITHQLLFVGFSLTDDNFHRIADAVRRALVPYRKEPRSTWNFGTALTLDRRPLHQALWGGDLSWVSMEQGDGGKTEERERELARKHEIFMDYVLAQATTASSHLLKAGFEGMLDDGQKELRARLLELARICPKDGDAAWEKVKGLLAELGHR